jgi:hypothetical protein
VIAAAVTAATLLGGDGGGGRSGELDFTGGRNSAAAFVDSIGVAVHLEYVDTSYARQPQVFERIRELGVRHLRAGTPLRSPPLENGLREAARLGLRATLVSDLERVAPAEGVAAGIRTMGRQVEAFEGPNEPDIFGPPDWRKRLAAYMPSLRLAARAGAANVPVIGPSFVDSANYEALDLDTFDVVSFHPYPGALPPERPLGEQLRRARDVAPGKQVAFTETGYHNALAATHGQPPTSEAAAAVYLPRALLWAFAAGVERTFIYELLDEKPDPGLVDPELHFGLLREDLTPKPAFNAVRNLIRTVLTSPGRASTPPPLPSVGSTARIERVALTRSDGSRVVALWRPVSVWDRDGRQPNDARRATVNIAWSTPVHDLSVTRPSLGGEPSVRRASASGLALELHGDVVLLSYR